MSRTRLVLKFPLKGYYEPTARIDYQKTLYTSLNTLNDVEDSYVREKETLSIRSL